MNRFADAPAAEQSPPMLDILLRLAVARVSRAAPIPDLCIAAAQLELAVDPNVMPAYEAIGYAVDAAEGFDATDAQIYMGAQLWSVAICFWAESTMAAMIQNSSTN
jgi:hypothetical protein